jgi:hypothetical protein
MFFSVTLFMALVLNVSASDRLQERTLSIPGRGMLVVSSPITWSQQISQPPETLAPTFRFSSTAGQKFEVSVTAFWSPTNDPSFNSSTNVRAIVENTLDELEPRLVETDIPLRKLHGGSGTGYYFSATDKAPGPNDYKYLTQGAMAVGDLLLTFTVLTKERDSSVVNDALNMVRSASRGT